MTPEIEARLVECYKEYLEEQKNSKINFLFQINEFREKELKLEAIFKSIFIITGDVIFESSNEELYVNNRKVYPIEKE